ncbi:MAG: hypothetical protein FJ267_01655, partial [Planctomycetes bacterium]|nr:hypothetical protein [Planctomycetota bacterium]
MNRKQGQNRNQSSSAHHHPSPSLPTEGGEIAYRSLRNHSQSKYITLLILITPIVLIATAANVSSGNDHSSLDRIEFNRDIRPILAAKCFRCHGLDPHARKGDLRLDDRPSAVLETRQPPAVVPGSPERSEVIRRIYSTNVDEQMPPPDSNLTL